MAQWPDDDFAHGTVPYGDRVNLYLGARPSTFDALYPFGRGYLHNGHLFFDGASGTTGGGAAFNFTAESTTADKLARAVLLRQRPAVECAVVASFRLKATQGTTNWTNLINRGVIARAQGGTLQDATTHDVRVENLTCYTAGARVDVSTFQIEFYIDRYNTGTRTPLFSFQVPVNTLDVTQLLLVGMRVRLTGATVQIEAEWSGWGSGQTLATTTFDATGSRITTLGHAGFFAGRDRFYSVTGVRCVDVCESFQTNNLGVGVHTSDDFVRYAPEVMSLAIGSGLGVGVESTGNPGRSLQQAYAYDGFHNFGNALTTRRLLKRGSSNRALVDFSAQSTSQSYACLSSRPATHIRSQARSVDLIVSSDTSGASVGILLRASAGLALAEVDSGILAYLMRAQITAAGVATFWLSRGNGSGGGALLATLAGSGTTYWPGFGVQWKLKFECWTQIGAGLNGPVVLRASVNGVVLPLVAPPGGLPSGVSIFSGVVTDGSGSRIVSGPAEGLWLDPEGANGLSLPIQIDNWRQEALTNAEPPADDLPTLDILTEEELVAVGNLDTVLAYDVTVRTVYSQYSVEHQMESGHVQAMNLYTSPIGAGISRGRYSLSKLGATKAERDALRDFWQDHDGPVIPFEMTEPVAGVLVRAAFVDGTWRSSKIAAGAYQYEVEVETIR